MKQRDAIRAGNIQFFQWNGQRPGCYLANGRLGAVLSGFGLNDHPKRQKENALAGRSHFCHMSHWGRFRFQSEATGGETVADYLLPLFWIYWEKEPETVTQYQQCQDFFDGTVTTEFVNETGQQVFVRAWTDMKRKNLAGFSISLSEGELAVAVDAVTDFIPYGFLYKKRTSQSVLATEEKTHWKLTVCCEDTVNQHKSEIYLYTNAQVDPGADGVRILLKSGKTDILISVGEKNVPATAEDSKEKSAAAWHDLWERTGWFSFPEERMQQMFIRSTAYLLASYSDAEYAIQPTSGLSGNMFPFHFVQDMGYIAPALMMLGHVDIVKAWLEKFAAEIPQMQQYAKHLWPEAKGIYPPWELPFGDMEAYHRPCVPVIYCYEPHNVGYLCRMAAETAAYLQDVQWTRAVAEPLIRECAAFYAAAANKGKDGFWHLRWYPCVGQDEAGGQNKSDYLCSLYSAKYCFEAMLHFGLDENRDYGQILKDGLCFETLLSDRGTYHTTRGADDFGKQKHPVQLDGVTYMPTRENPLSPEIKAYGLRHDITDGAKVPYYEGWTLGQFLLAGTNLGDTEGWRMDWNQLRQADYTDPDWVQLYETSSQTEKSFYMATHGLILQSLIRNYVNDYWDRLDIAACPVCRNDVVFRNIHTKWNQRVSGEMKNGVCTYRKETV